MRKPRLMYYSDAHHYHAKRIEPPTSIHKLQWPVDELVGTGVDVLVYGLGYGDVYFHDSKVGRVVGQEKEVWENFIDWRIMCMVRDARKLGTDQVREVIRRGKEKGLTVFPSLKLQDQNEPGSERCGRLKWRRHEEVCLNEEDEARSRHKYCYDFSNELVHEDKLNMVREILADYEADGLELDFMFYPDYFRAREVEKNIPVMNRFVGRVRELANEIGKKQGREIPICARVFDSREENLRIGLDLETWLKEKSVDLVVGQVSEQFVDTGMDVRWLADVANAAGVPAYIYVPRRIYDERTPFPSIEMYRALGQTLLWQGIAGMYLGYMPWPFSETEYQVLREAADPGAHARSDKRYLLQPREPALAREQLSDYGRVAPPPGKAVETLTRPPERQLPVKLEEGKTARLTIFVADDVDSARKDGEMRRPVLTIRFASFCIEDEVEIRFNGVVLPLEKGEFADERALAIPVRVREPIDAPLGMSAHWFRYWLPVDSLKRGENVVEVETKKMAKEAGFARSINGVEIQTRYKDWVRPEGIGGAPRIAPRAT